jgi:glycosyltransferase involved in cell wall biosynthesis
MEDSLTIAIPVYNRSAYIREALESVLQQETQTRILVLDNDSTQFDFAALVRSYASPRIRYIRNEVNVGMAGNWNRCIDACETPFLALVHDDDKLEADYATKVVKRLDNGVAAVFCRCGLIDRFGHRTGEVNLEGFRRCRDLANWCSANYFYTGIAFNVGVARRIGKFRTGLQFTPDYDLWFRLAAEGRFELIEDIIGLYRIYDSPERITSNLAAKFEITPRLMIQFRRNIHLYKTLFPNDTQPIRPRANIKFRDLVRQWRYFSNRMARYALAAYANGESQSIPGSLARRTMRIIGRPVLSVLAGIYQPPTQPLT